MYFRLKTSVHLQRVSLNYSLGGTAILFVIILGRLGVIVPGVHMTLYAAYTLYNDQTRPIASL